MHNATRTGRRKKQPVKFACVEGCSDCCIYREYYPSPDFGKIGVLLLPEEKDKIEKLAREKGIEVRILPRLAVGDKAGPEKVIAYQMMGKQKDGDLCPFLDLEKRSLHGGFACGIYKQRPLACSAYPVVDADSRVATLDSHCQFCKHHDSTKADLEGLQNELESLSKIKSVVKAKDDMHVWRYATATGEQATLDEGWVLES
jgi:Fe-S-cluster containining protein